MITIFQKEYDGESLYDLDRDICEAFQTEYNPAYAAVPADEHGLKKGTFKVTAEWTADTE